jgi:NTE family protein
MMAGSNRDALAGAEFTLLLGAGFFGFFAHAGLLLALEEAGLRPRRVVGVSAGALAGGLWASGLRASELAEELVALRRQDFWDPGFSPLGLLQGKRFSAKLHELLGRTNVVQVEDAVIPFAAVASDIVRWRPVVLESGPMELAIRASCSVPVMFRPVRVEGRLLVDGGVLDRSGFSAVEAGERVLFHHLPHGSPWSRWHGSEERALEPAPGRTTVTFPPLPRVTPFRLERGADALAHVRHATHHWLDRTEVVQNAHVVGNV